MFYYKVDGNKIFKYEVSYDLEIIKKLQKDLANDCSIEKEYTYSSVGVPHRDKNVKCKYWSVVKNMNGTLYSVKNVICKPWRDIYEVNTIELITPPLYNLIEEILKGNVLALEKLFAKKIDLKEKNVKDVDYYQVAFQHLFKVTLVDAMDLEMYEKLLEFVDSPKLKNKYDYSLVLNKGKKK